MRALAVAAMIGLCASPSGMDMMHKGVQLLHTEVRAAMPELQKALAQLRTSMRSQQPAQAAVQVHVPARVSAPVPVNACIDRERKQFKPLC